MLQYTKEVISLSEKRTHYPTIKDVAKLANTSTATVSYILNEDASRPISQELRASCGERTELYKKCGGVQSPHL